MFFILIALIVSISCSASERILLFKSDITIHPDASMSVVETIQVRATGDAIKRGIVREFPTKYKDTWGNNFNVAFRVEDIKRDNKEEPYHIEAVSNGKKIYIGTKEVLLSPGIYTYTIAYTTNRQLGFFKEYDELYWNVTGNGWRLPIDKVFAQVHLPSPIPRDQIKAEAYVGYQGSKEQSSIAYVQKAHNTVFFEKTRPLQKYEGLTIVVTWPKGYIVQPSAWQQWWDFFKDNLHIVIAILGFICLLIWYIVAWIRFRATQYIGTIIPLFYPPDSMTPGLMRYFNRMNYDSVVLASDIVDMAVHGLLTIEHKPGFFKNQYMLHKKEEQSDIAHYVLLLNALFDNRESFSLDEKNASRIDAAIDIESNKYSFLCRHYFQSAIWYSVGGVVIAIIFSLALLLLMSDSHYILFIAFVLYIGLNVVAGSALKGYSPEGLRIKKEIDGFRMFLATTEEERLKIIGTPPTKTPELYEKYLPYAIALDVEKQWAAQFAPLFEEMRRAGHPYVSVWYLGDYRSFSGTSFASRVNSSSSAISSSSSRPGGSSGSGGRGSSGGGGGGGGGGGW